MSDLRLIIILFTRASLSVIVSYATWLVCRANILRSRIKEEEPHA